MKTVWIVKAIKMPIENIAVSEKHTVALEFCKEMLNQGFQVTLLNVPLLESRIDDR